MAQRAEEGLAGGESAERHSLGGPLLKFEQAVADFQQVLAPGVHVLGTHALTPDGSAASPGLAGKPAAASASWSDSMVSPAPSAPTGASRRAGSPTVRAPDKTVFELVAWDALEARLAELTEGLRGELAAAGEELREEMVTVSSRLEGALAAIDSRQMVEHMVEEQVNEMSGQLQQALQQSAGLAAELGRLDGMLRSAQQWEEEFNSKLLALNQVQMQGQSDFRDLSRELGAVRLLGEQAQGRAAEALSGLDQKLRADLRNLEADLRAPAAWEAPVCEAPEASRGVAPPRLLAGAGTDGQEGQAGGRGRRTIFANTFSEGAAPPAAQGAAGRGLPRAQTLPVAAGAGGTGGREERVSPARGAQEGTTEEADGGGLTGIIEGIDGKVDIGLRRVDNSIGELWEKIERVATSLDTLKNQLRNI